MLGNKIVQYIKPQADKISHGQDAKTGIWYCKNLNAETVEESRILINDLNEMYNEFNKQAIERMEKKATSPQKK